MNNDEIFPGYTPRGLEQRIVSTFRSVRAVEWRIVGPGQAIGKLKIRWWAWPLVLLTAGKLIARVHELVDREKPAAVMCLFEVG